MKGNVRTLRGKRIKKMAYSVRSPQTHYGASWHCRRAGCSRVQSGSTRPELPLSRSSGTGKPWSGPSVWPERQRPLCMRCYQHPGSFRQVQSFLNDGEKKTARSLSRQTDKAWNVPYMYLYTQVFCVHNNSWREKANISSIIKCGNTSYFKTCTRTKHLWSIWT